LVHHLKRQLHLQLVTIGMGEDLPAVSNAEMGSNLIFLVHVSIEQSSVVRVWERLIESD